MYSVRNCLFNIGDSLLEQPGLCSGLIFGLIQIGPSDPCELFSFYTNDNSKHCILPPVLPLSTGGINYGLPWWRVHKVFQSF